MFAGETVQRLSLPANEQVAEQNPDEMTRCRCRWLQSAAVDSTDAVPVVQFSSFILDINISSSDVLHR